MLQTGKVVTRHSNSELCNIKNKLFIKLLDWRRFKISTRFKIARSKLFSGSRNDTRVIWGSFNLNTHEQTSELI